MAASCVQSSNDLIKCFANSSEHEQSDSEPAEQLAGARVSSIVVSCHNVSGVSDATDFELEALRHTPVGALSGHSHIDLRASEYRASRHIWGHAREG